MKSCLLRNTWYLVGFIRNTSYGDALSTIFLLACFCALLPTFRFSFLFSFFSYFFPASRYVYLLRVPSSVQQPSTLSKYIRIFIERVCARVVCTLPHLGILLFFVPSLLLFFRSSYFSGGVFLVVLSYPVR